MLHRLAWLLLVVSGPAAAWGDSGHAAIAAQAERQLSATARTAIAWLLIDEPNPSLAAVASWADRIRGEDGWRWTAPLHYVNFDEPGCSLDLRRNCPEGRCVIGAIERYADDLANRSLSRRQRAEALKFLVHFIGDIHQPLHASDRPDSGGNEFQVHLDGQGTNLHAVWDRHVLGADLSDLSTMDSDARRVVVADRGGGPLHWAAESCRLIEQLAIYPAAPGHLPAGYLERMRPHARKRLTLAAGRLAIAIERALNPR